MHIFVGARAPRPGAVWLLAIAASCGGESQPSAATTTGHPPALAVECDADEACARGQVCAQARCYEACATPLDCSARERCAETGELSGLCVATDAGTERSPCDGKVCVGSTPACQARTGECVACTAEEHCGGGEPVCDRAKGRCVTARAELCAPCHVDADCQAQDAGGALRCVATASFERVCLPAGCTDDADCAADFECSASTGACSPKVGSCAAYVSIPDASTPEAGPQDGGV